MKVKIKMHIKNSSSDRGSYMCAAQALGLPFLIPSMADGKDFRRGANMAIVGGTVLDYDTGAFTGYDVNLNGSMKNQMEALQRLLPSI